MPTKLTESKAERCSVLSYSVLRSYYSELPHLAHPPDEADGGGAAAGRNGLDHDCLISKKVGGLHKMKVTNFSDIAPQKFEES
jgi:hypothetical protein